MIKYRWEDLTKLVNETLDVSHNDFGLVFRPGDIVRHQMFDGDDDPHEYFPIGLVLYVNFEDANPADYAAVLWSQDPGRMKTIAF